MESVASCYKHINFVLISINTERCMSQRRYSHIDLPSYAPLSWTVIISQYRYLDIGPRITHGVSYFVVCGKPA